MASTSARPPLRAVLIGAGNRGRSVYGAWALAHPQELRFVAVAESDPLRLSLFAREHGIPEAGAFPGWRELFAAGGIEAEACLVCTQDAYHVDPALAALEAGLHVLVEKPMATRPEDCRRLVDAAEAAARQLRVCHVVRYTAFFRAVKRALDTGLIGRPIHIAHTENVSHWHYGHSYVRGAWNRSGESSPIVLAKTCHDLDILHWLAGRPARKLSSFGELSFFRPENAPPGAPERCLDGCPHAATCLWHVDRLYRGGERLLSVGKRADNPLIRLAAGAAIGGGRLLRGLGRVWPRAAGLGLWKGWPADVITGDPSPAGREAALRRGRYGLCIFRCGNDQMDHQVVAIEFEGGLTATMTMEGLSNLDGRSIRIDGSAGSLEGSFTYAGERLEYWDHASMRRHLLHRSGFTGDAHGGGDAGLMASFVASLRGAAQEGGREGDRAGAPGGAGGRGGQSEVLTSGRASLESHLMGFAAQLARVEARVVDMEELRGRESGISSR